MNTSIPDGTVKEISPTLPTNEGIAHLSWCALIALYMHKHEHGEMSVERETRFLIRWCLRALKKKSFAEKNSKAFHFLAQDWQDSGLSDNLHQYLLNMWMACI